MPKVELIYDSDCPNPENAREQLRRAFARVGLEPHWTEWQADDPGAPAHVHGYGSPTVLVNGRDVAGATPVPGMRGCRVYASAAGEPRGAPPLEAIIAALRGGRSA
jgi:mercuric ion transport protein